MSEGQSTGETILPEQRYQQINEGLKRWAQEEGIKSQEKGKEIPDAGSPSIVARESPAGIRFSRTLPWQGGQILEVWEMPEDPKNGKKLSYGQTKYDKEGNKLSWRRAWYGESEAERAGGGQLRQDFDIFEKFEYLQSLTDQASKTEPQPLPPNVVDIASLRNRKKN